MELAEWIETTVKSRLIVRMELTSFSSNPEPGNEGVRASLTGYSPNVPLMAHVQFERFGGATVGSLYIDVEDDPTSFAGFIEHMVVSHWDQRRDMSWETRSDKVFQLRTSSDGTGIKRQTLHATNVLVLQHLAHIQGAIGQSLEKFGVDQMPVLVHMTHVLGTIITQGNKELMRLTQMS